MPADPDFTLNERIVLRAMPTMPETTTASLLASALPYLSRSTIDKALRGLRSSVLVLEGSGGKHYARYPEGSLL